MSTRLKVTSLNVPSLPLRSVDSKETVLSTATYAVKSVVPSPSLSTGVPS